MVESKHKQVKQYELVKSKVKIRIQESVVSWACAYDHVTEKEFIKLQNHADLD
jgi:hypothetical protein